jgi:hypothetical protein
MGKAAVANSGEQLDPYGDSTGVRATACLHRENVATREAPTVRVRNFQPDAREGQAGP